MKLVTILLLFSFNISLSLSTNGCPSQWGPTPIPHPFGISPMWFTAILGIILGVILMLLCALWQYFSEKHRSIVELKRRYFLRYGGLLLEQQISSREGSNSCARIFSAEELKKATNGYHSSRIVATVSNGTVYRGVLKDGTVVAVKRLRVMDWVHTELSIDDLVVLTQINHRNVVKLLGCCLETEGTLGCFETEGPMLVYEFISNGTLSVHIRGPVSRIAWRDRMRIAIETAEAVAYLHSITTELIYHGNVESSSILLDENYTPKVLAFGISWLVGRDRETGLRWGSYGYELPAAYDVYKFGFVLAELLLEKEAVSFQMPKERIRLANYFLSSLRSKELGEFIDDDVSRHGSADELRGVAELARKCLKVTWARRLSMKEVLRELVRLRDLQK